MKCSSDKLHILPSQPSSPEVPSSQGPGPAGHTAVHTSLMVLNQTEVWPNTKQSLQQLQGAQGCLFAPTDVASRRLRILDRRRTCKNMSAGGHAATATSRWLQQLRSGVDIMP